MSTSSSENNFDKETWLAKVDAAGISATDDELKSLLAENNDKNDVDRNWLEGFIDGRSLDESHCFS